MDKETLSQYGWIVVAILVLTIMIAMATPFGTYVSNAVKSTTQGLFDVQQKAMGIAGLNVDDQNIGNNVGYNHNAKELHLTKVDLGNGRIIPQTSDIFIYKDYEYRYNYICGNNNVWKQDESINGWGVKCINYCENPCEILESINGAPITNMYMTFYKSTELLNAPEIPLGVTEINYAFSGCASLVTAPNLPVGIIEMQGAFSRCTSLINVPTIPNTVTILASAFDGCKALVNAPDLSQATKLSNTFSAFANCISLKNIRMPKTLASIDKEMLDGCTSLTNIYYNGTMSEWNKLYKGDSWNYNVPASYIQCSDGIIEFNMAEIV